MKLKIDGKDIVVRNRQIVGGTKDGDIVQVVLTPVAFNSLDCPKSIVYESDWTEFNFELK